MNLSRLPPNLPIPEDDGGCTHLLEKAIPDISLPNQDGIYHANHDFTDLDEHLSPPLVASSQLL